MWIVGPRWGKPTFCDFPTWLDIVERSKLHKFWQLWSPLECTHHEPTSYTPRFKCGILSKFISIKWTYATMKINQTISAKTNVEDKLHLVWCWFVECNVDCWGRSKIKSTTQFWGVFITSLKNHCTVWHWVHVEES